MTPLALSEPQWQPATKASYAWLTRVGSGLQVLVEALRARGEGVQVLGAGRRGATTPAARATAGRRRVLARVARGLGDRDGDGGGRRADGRVVATGEPVLPLLEDVAVVVLLLPRPGGVAALLLLARLLLELGRAVGDLAQPHRQLGGVGRGDRRVLREELGEVSLEVGRALADQRPPLADLAVHRRRRRLARRDQRVGRAEVERNRFVDEAEGVHGVLRKSRARGPAGSRCCPRDCGRAGGAEGG